LRAKKLDEWTDNLNGEIMFGEDLRAWENIIAISEFIKMKMDGNHSKKCSLRVYGVKVYSLVTRTSVFLHCRRASAT
jgi:hypothetical protein